MADPPPRIDAELEAFLRELEKPVPDDHVRVPCASTMALLARVNAVCAGQLRQAAPRGHIRRLGVKR